MKDKIKKLEKKAAKLKMLRDKFPDLDENRDRWGKIRLTAKSANTQVTDIETHHSCGCCNDAPFLARPYLEYEGERVYSNPASVYIGEKSTAYYGNVWDEDWQDKIKAIGVPQIAIDKLIPQWKKDDRRKTAYNSYQENLNEID